MWVIYLCYNRGVGGNASDKEARIVATIPLEINEDEIMSSVFDNLWLSSSPWLVEYDYDGYSDKSVPVTYDNPEYDYYDPKNDAPKTLTQSVSKAQLVDAYAKLLGDKKHHCFGEPVPLDFEEWDTCVSDYVLQYALFGELIYG